MNAMARSIIMDTGTLKDMNVTLPFDARQNIIPSFETPIGRFALQNAGQINPGLRRAILERRTTHKARGRSNIGGWHSTQDLFNWPVPEIKTLENSIRQGVNHLVGYTAKAGKFESEIELVGWANVNAPGAYHRVHNHAMAHWSGVYYVQSQTGVQATSSAGNIEFYDPRGAINMMSYPGNNGFGLSMVMSSTEGHMVLFPSWLYHSVTSTMGGDDRISIAFNARITAFRRYENN